MKLQYQLSNGNWADCNERTDEMLSDALGFAQQRDPAVTIGTITALLNAGKKLPHRGGDWYANIRIQPAATSIQPQARGGDISHAMMNSGYGKLD